MESVTFSICTLLQETSLNQNSETVSITVETVPTSHCILPLMESLIFHLEMSNINYGRLSCCRESYCHSHYQCSRIVHISRILHGLRLDSKVQTLLKRNVIRICYITKTFEPTHGTE